MTGLDLAAHGLGAPSAPPAIPGGGPQTVAAILDRPIVEHADAVALVGRHARYTFATLDTAVERACSALSALGVRPGARVAAALANHPDIVVCFLATLRLGAIWVGVNRVLAPAEQAYILRDAGVSVYLTEPEGAELLAVHDCGPLEHVVTVDPERFAIDGLGADAGSGPVRVPVAPTDPAAIAYTSGTTGFPKGVVHSHRNLLLPGAVTALTRQYDPTLVQGVCLPLTVLNLMVLGPCVTLQLGAPLVCMDRVDPVGMAEWIRAESIATFSAVPTMIHGLLTHPDVRRDDLASLVRPGVGGADLPESFRTLYRERFGAEVTIGYGLTEAPTAVTVTDPGAAPIPNEAGVALPQVEIWIVGDDGARLDPGETGEICVAPATQGELAGVYTPMLGYWNQPAATADALRDGVLHTGDVGYVDGDGHLFVKDRRNDLVIRGGANVYPAEVERVLHADPRVRACAVVGAPDERLGERVVAFVEVADGVEADDDLWAALATHCRGELARYKVPDRWIALDALPRNAMGKIRKPELRAKL